MSGILRGEYVRTYESMHPLRLERGALLGVYAPQDEGGQHIAGARIDWLTGEPIEVWSTTREGNETILASIHEWQEYHGFGKGEMTLSSRIGVGG